MVEQRVDVLRRQRRQRDRQAAGHLDRAHVGEPKRHLRLRRLAVAHPLDVFLVADLRDRHADHWSAHRSTHVSLLPPFCEELTTSASASKATRVRPPGSTCTCSPLEIANGRRSTWRGSKRPSVTVGWRESMTVSCTTNRSGAAASSSAALRTSSLRAC